MTIFEIFENFMKNVGKRLSHREKKGILSLDTIHESIDSGCGERGAGVVYVLLYPVNQQVESVGRFALVHSGLPAKAIF